jgi:predicted outer membrane repeat protein
MIAVILINPKSLLCKATGAAILRNISRVSICCVLLFMAGAALADTHLVPSEYYQIKLAYDAAAPGDTILVSSGTYYERLTLDKAFYLISESGPETTIIDSYNLFTAVDLRSSDIVMDGFTITRGKTSGMIISNCSPEIRNCIFTANQGQNGAALRALLSSAVITNCVFENNVSSQRGGALYLDQSPVTLDNCVITGNSAVEFGGGIFFAKSDAIVTNTVIASNSAVSGGGIYSFLTGSSPEFHNCTFTNNTASEDGSGLFFFSGSEPVIANSIIAFNQGAEAVYCYGTARLTAICNNIYNNSGGDELCGVTIEDNISVDPFFCDLGAGDFTLRSDSDCLPANNTCSVLIGAQPQGCQGGTSTVRPPGSDPVLMFATALHPCHPNPFNPKTTVDFSLERPGLVRILIHDLRGQLVRVLVDEAFATGRHQQEWSGLDNTGRRVPSGVYFVTLSTENYRETRRMALLK